MTASRELREEGHNEGFAIIALGHALFAEERLEPAHGVPGTEGRVKVRDTQGSRDTPVRGRHTPLATPQLPPWHTQSQLLPCFKKRTPSAASDNEAIPPTIQVSSSWGMTNCSTDRRSRRSSRTGAGNSRPGIRGWRISGSLHELAACCGTKLVQAFTSGVALGGQPSRTRCTVHGPDVSCSRLGEAVGTASGITSGLSNTGSSTEFGVPACQPLQRVRPPQGWSAVHAIGVAAPEGSAGGEDPRSRRAAVH